MMQHIQSRQVHSWARCVRLARVETGDAERSAGGVVTLCRIGEVRTLQQGPKLECSAAPLLRPTDASHDLPEGPSDPHI